MNAPVRNLTPAAPAAPPAVATQATTPAMAKFIHLKVHSAYSLLEGALPIPMLAKMAEKYGHPALALTDTNNMFGVLEASDKLAGSGIQPIAGVSLSLDFQEKKAERRNPSGSPVRPLPHKDGLIALYAMTEEGYSNLMQLISKAHLESPDTEGPHIKIADLATRGAGIIALTAFISPYRRDRDAVRRLLAPGDFVEVYVKAPLEVCEDRDPKGLYKKARAGEIKGFTGIDDPYEEPLAPELVVDSAAKRPDELAAEVIAWLERNGKIALR